MPVIGMDAATREAVGRQLDVMHAMPYTEALARAASMTDQDLARSLGHCRLNIAMAVSDHIPTRPDARASAFGLAKAALKGRTVADPDDVIRDLLRMPNRMADAVLFFHRERSDGTQPARYAVLADRRGPDGRPIIDDEIRKRLLEQIESRRRPGRIEAELRAAAAVADDPQIAQAIAGRGFKPDKDDDLDFRRFAPDWEALLAKAESHSQPEHARGLLARRADLPAAIRAALEAIHPAAHWLVPRPDVEAVRRALAGIEPTTPAGRFALGVLLRRGLAGGSLDAAEVVATVRPVAALLAFLAPTRRLWDDRLALRSLAFPDDARRWLAATMRDEAEAVLAPVLSQDPAAWAWFLHRATTWPGTLPELVAEIARGAAGNAGPPPVGFPRRAPEDAGDAGAADDSGDCLGTADPIAVVASLMPRPVFASTLAAHLEGWDPAAVQDVARLLEREPLVPDLAELALGPQGTASMRHRLAHNPGADLAMLWRIAAWDPAEPHALSALYRHPGASYELRTAVVIRSYSAGGLHPSLLKLLESRAPGTEPLTRLLASGDATALHAALQAVLGTVDPGHLLLGYAALAAAAGPEPVWALELERVGSLDRVIPDVRASMATGSAAPLTAAADPTRIPTEP
ncbi:hypothetical protein KGQ20_21805 [Catenulispora sp. NF23]|uniref:Uncharacterized protein n=1 Tax=Catenulispora pinistramenti TaxID=2705254 RepID=A0ABS5L0Z3_9ACTN|nr:hypothetical protein [Catenulispora pinistramenti]MBS2535403.1 hypothetical protein [Catenulispora pinistramenti]MBS2551929.1 hypothetical protein [Catenulispora pinistramenti]